jgi:hypothetical protein
MIKKGIFYLSVLFIVAFISLGFKSKSKDFYNDFYKDEISSMEYVFPSLVQVDYNNFSIPYKGKFFIGFKEHLAFKESQGKYHKVNTLGYLGKYQFGIETLKSIGIYDSIHFLNNPKLQEKAFITLLSKNKYELRDYISKHEGTYINGVKITESGILAAAHLGGIGSVKKFFKTNGTRVKKDAYGTSIQKYMRDFAGYETHKIPAVKNARVK